MASDRLAGRQAGSEGAQLAGDYIVTELKQMGARPLPGQKDFLLPFSFTAGVKDGGTALQVAAMPAPGAGATRVFDQVSQVQALSFSDNAEVSGPVVFAGYGLVVPESQNFGYDSYATLDVKDKVVVVFRYFPEDADQKTRADSVALRRSPLQGDAGASARRQGDAGRHRPALAERRRDHSDELRHGAGRVGNRRGECQRRGRRRRCSAACSGKTLDDIQKSFDSRQSSHRRLRRCPA